VSRVLNVVLCHQERAVIQAVLAHWRRVAPLQAILLAHGGRHEDFDRVEHPNKIFIDDARLRTRDNQRERQSYQAIWRETARWLNSSSNEFEFVHVAEYDHLPLISDLNSRQIDLLEKEGADVLAHHLQRIDQTSHPHYLYHSTDPSFHAFFEGISARTDKRVILSMFGTGSFWRRAAFEKIAAFDEPFPVYFEVYLPTLAHHLGFRLRNYGDQDRFISHLGDRGQIIDTARRQGAWTLHPVKKIFNVS
jgi:hypothetical protein